MPWEPHVGANSTYHPAAAWHQQKAFLQCCLKPAVAAAAVQPVSAAFLEQLLGGLHSAGPLDRRPPDEGN